MGDIAELIQTAKRIAAIVPTSEAGETLAGLADALEALNRENAVLTKVRDVLADEVTTRTAERDALRAQLDSMTTRWGIEMGRTVIDATEADAKRWGDRGRKRLVGPWEVAS